MTKKAKRTRSIKEPKVKGNLSERKVEQAIRAVIQRKGFRSTSKRSHKQPRQKAASNGAPARARERPHTPTTTRRRAEDLL